MSKIFVAGHHGMIGSAICRTLDFRGHQLVLAGSSQDVDLSDQSAVFAFLEYHRPECVVIAAERFGRVDFSDTLCADVIYQNLMIQTNLIHGAWRTGVSQLLLLADHAVYPNLGLEEYSEDLIFSSSLNLDFASYALAKLAGIKMCESYNKQYGTAYMSAISCQLYGPNEHTDAFSDRLVWYLIHRLHTAKLRRDKVIHLDLDAHLRYELLFVDDFSRACVMLLESSRSEYLFNIGSGTIISLFELAQMLATVVGYHGELVFSSTTICRGECLKLNTDKIRAYGWKPEVHIKQGLKQSYAYFLEQGHADVELV